MTNSIKITGSLPPVQAYECCSGFGQYHTDEFDETKPDKLLKPYCTITWADIKQMVDDPHSVHKKSAQWIIPSSLKSRNFRDQETRGEFVFLWLDLDDNTLPIQLLHKKINRVLGGKYRLEIYCTASATKNLQKSRVLIPLEFPLNGEEWRFCQEILNDQIESVGVIPDRATERCAQICYLPNRGDYYDSSSDRTSALFDPLQTFQKDITDKKQAIAKAEQEAQERSYKAAKRRASLIYSGSSSGNLITAFNETHAIETILIQCGYDQRGDRFRHSNSQSGIYSASVKNGRVHTLSSSDPLYTGGGGGGAHDSFSTFQTLFHSSDMTEALKDAGDKWLSIGGESWNTVRRREYMKSKQEQNIMSQDEKDTGNNLLEQISMTPWDTLQNKEFDPVEWLVHDFLPPGVSILSGDPKQGKSFLIHSILLLVAAGRSVFAMKTQKCKVLYLALEDGERRLKNRTEIIMKAHQLKHSDIGKNFNYSISGRTLDEGLIAELDNLLSQDEGLRLIVIDVLARIRSPRRANQSIYEWDYGIGKTFKELTAKHPNLAIVLVHHNNKGDGDALNSVSGTNGLLGGVDNGYVKNGSSGQELHILARDVENSESIYLTKFDTGKGMFTLEGREAAKEKIYSATRKTIINAIKNGCNSPKDIQSETRISKNILDQRLFHMVRQKILHKPSRGHYEVTSLPDEAK